MLTVILIGLGGMLSVAMLFATGVIFRAAFWGEHDAAKEAEAVLTWRPSFLRGAALRDWAASSAEQCAQRHLNGKRTSETAVELVHEITTGAGHAMLPLAHQSELERTVPCPAAGQGRVGVTAVEALSIAAHIRKTHSRREQRR